MNNGHNQGLDALSTIWRVIKLPIQSVTKQDKIASSLVGVFIETSDYKQYYDSLGKLLSLKKELSHTVSEDFFRRSLLQFIKPLKEAGEVAQQKHLTEFYSLLCAQPIQQFSIFRRISGIEITSLVPLKLGDFCLYKTDIHKQELLNDSYNKPALFEEVSEYLIRVSVAAREPEYSVQIAEERFTQFERVIAYILGSQHVPHAISIFPENASRVDLTYVASAESAMHVRKRSRQGGRARLDIEDVTNLDGNDTLWNIVANPNPCELQARILLAVDWLGQARLERSASNAILKAAIATEILFNLDNSTIAPSINSQIAESMALVVGGDVETRLYILKQMKRLYGLRSSVTHRGKVDVDDYEVHLLMSFASEAVMILLSRKPYRLFEVEAQLKEYLNEMKFSGPALPRVIKDNEET